MPGAATPVPGREMMSSLMTCLSRRPWIGGRCVDGDLGGWVIGVRRGVGVVAADAARHAVAEEVFDQCKLDARSARSSIRWRTQTPAGWSLEGASTCSIQV